MKRITCSIVFIAALFIIIINAANAQVKGQARADSLMKELPGAKDDTSKARLLSELSYTYSGIKPEEGLKYGKQALELSEKISWKKGIVIAKLRIGHTYRAMCEFDKALVVLFEALPVSEEAGNKNLTAKILGMIGDTYNFLSDYKKSLDYCFKAAKIYSEIDDKVGMSGNIGNIGITYLCMSDYNKALACFQRSLEVAQELNDTGRMTTSLGNIGLVYNNLADYPKALEYYFKALKLCEAIGNKGQIAVNLGNIGDTYFNLSDFPKALEYEEKSLKLMEELGEKYGMAARLNNIGNIYASLRDYTKAEDYFSRALRINRETGSRNYEAINLLNMGDIRSRKSDHSAALEYFFKSLAIFRELGDLSSMGTAYTGIGSSYLEIAKDSTKVLLNKLFSGNKTEALKKAQAYSDSALTAFITIGDLKERKDVYRQISEIQAYLGDYKNALENYKKYADIKDSVFNEANNKKISNLEAKRTEELNQKQIEIRDLQISKAKIERWYFLGGIFVLVILSGLLYNRYRLKNKANKIIAKEKQRSDELLLNILPSEVAEELKETGTAKALRYPSITVMFTDFKDFSRISESLTPEQLVKEIDFYFGAFDTIIQKYKLEKIKTIGDSYMCAGGLPSMNFTHPEDVVKAALEIRDFIDANKKERQDQGKAPMEIRIGVNSGSVVAGIVGVKKFAYDIWGDTVNLASRMQSSGEVGKVNISGSTYDMIKDKFRCTYRGKIEAKNKGMIDMYFVENL